MVCWICTINDSTSIWIDKRALYKEDGSIQKVEIYNDGQLVN